MGPIAQTDNGKKLLIPTQFAWNKINAFKPVSDSDS